jgi:signal transduction histidine kinase
MNKLRRVPLVRPPAAARQVPGAFTVYQEQRLFVLRALVVVALGGASLIAPAAEPARLSAFIALGAAVAVLHGVWLWLAARRARRGQEPAGRAAVLAADALLCAAAVVVAPPDARVLAAVGAAAVFALTRVHLVGALIQIGLCTLLGVGVLAGVQADADAAVNGPLVASVCVLGVLGAAAAYAHFSVYRQLAAEQVAARSAYQRQMRAYRDRANLLFEVSQTMGQALTVEGILDAALIVGRLGIAVPQPGDTLVSAVLLFQTDDGLMHVAASRGFARADEAKTCAGTEGLLARALEGGEPAIGDRAADDPELAYYTAFQPCRSILCIPLRAGYENFGVIVYGSERERAFLPDQLDVLTLVGTQVTMALQNAMLYRSLLDERSRIVDLEEDARKKLARALHDGPTQTIAAVAMRLSVLYKMLSKAPERVPDEIRKIEALARTTTKEIRHMLFTLRPLVLETQGLFRALEQFTVKMREAHDQNVVIRMNRDVELLLDRNMQSAIFYIVEEAVNNARKHAQATLISVTVALRTDEVHIQIADNGRGFNVQAVSQGYDARGSLGMMNMRERTELLEGRFTIESALGRGTTVLVVLPLRDGDAAPAPAHIDREHAVTRIAVSAVERVSRPPTHPKR